MKLQDEYVVRCQYREEVGKNGSGISNYHSLLSSSADIHKVGVDGLCGMDGGKQLPATI